MDDKTRELLRLIAETDPVDAALDPQRLVAIAAAALAAAPTPQCWCHTCRPVSSNPPENMRMIVCPDCGNKRCPKANDHRNACTGSNAPGQPGSAYPAAHTPPDVPAMRECRRCNGSGWVTRDADIGSETECFVCGGAGKIVDDAPTPPASEPDEPQTTNEWYSEQYAESPAPAQQEAREWTDAQLHAAVAAWARAAGVGSIARMRAALNAAMKEQA